VTKLVSDFKKMRSLMQQMGQGNLPGMGGGGMPGMNPFAGMMGGGGPRPGFRGPGGGKSKKKKKQKKKKGFGQL
jgi:signal recognition particle subunit SRP54